MVKDTSSGPYTAAQPPDWKVDWLKTAGVELAKAVPGSYPAIRAAVRLVVPTAPMPMHATRQQARSRPIGRGVDELVTALTSIPGVLVSVPVHDLSIDGFSGKAFDLESTLIDADCPDDGAWFPMWTFDDGGTQAFSGPGSNFHQHMAVLDVHGTRAPTGPGCSYGLARRRSVSRPSLIGARGSR